MNRESVAQLFCISVTPKYWLGVVLSLCFAFAAEAGPVMGERMSVSGQKEILPKGELIESPAELAKRLQRWDDEIVEAAMRQGPMQWPKTLSFNFSPRARFNVIEASVKLKRAGLKTAHDMASQFSDGDVNLQMPLARLLNGPLRSRAYQNYEVVEASEEAVQKFMNRLEFIWKIFLNDIDFSHIRIAAFMDGAVNHNAISRQYQEKYRESGVITDSVLDRAAFPLIGAHLLAESYGYQVASLPAVAAYSFLFPLMDDGLDKGGLNDESLSAISNILKGEAVKPRNSYETVIFDLIRVLLDEYPRASHPLVVSMLQDLHQAQIKAHFVQKDPKSSLEEILRSESRKGGLTAALGAYLSVGTLSRAELEADYKTGVLFQLGDDLVDYREDLRLKINTIWSQGSNSEPERMADGLRVFLNTHRHLEDVFEAKLMDRSARQARINSAALISRGYLFGAYLSEEQPSFFRRVLREKIPLSARNIRSVITALLRQIKSVNANRREISDAFTALVKTADTHMLSGQLAKSDTRYRPGLSPSKIYRIRSWNPLVAVVKLVHGMQEGLKQGSSSNGLGRVVFPLGLILWHAWMLQSLPPGISQTVGWTGLFYLMATGYFDRGTMMAKKLLYIAPPWSTFVSCSYVLHRIGAW